MFNSERSALKNSSKSDEELLDSALEVIAKMIPSFQRDYLVSYERTNWCQDEYARMCYTYIAKGASPDNFKTLKQPINDLIYLCGEHTCYDFVGTVNGAYISGIEAAERIISSYI